VEICEPWYNGGAKILRMNDRIPAVSVIIPVYNTERYLARCLESVLSQTLTDIEIIVVDDCSPDGSADVVRRFLQQDERITYIRHDKNLGLGGARNTGIAAARGDFIVSLDSDDALTDKALEIAVGRCESDKTEIGVFSCLIYSEKTGKLSQNSLYDLDEFPRVLSVDEFNILKIVPTFQLKIYKGDLIERYGVRFSDHVYHEDDEFYWKLFGCALPRVSIIPQKLYFRTRRADQSSIMDNTAKSRKDMPKVLKNAYSFLNEKDAFQRVRLPFVYKVCRNLCVITYVHHRYRRKTFADLSDLLNALDPTDEEVGSHAWQDEIREIRKNDFVGYLNWKIDSLSQRSREVQNDSNVSALEELEQVYASNSWRITAPLRWVVGKFRISNRQ
jgi:glycosyltransferase involved in cell wall biosynthesis